MIGIWEVGNDPELHEWKGTHSRPQMSRTYVPKENIERRIL